MTDLTADLVKSVFDLGARVRHARVFHPEGIRLSGRFRAAPEFRPWFGDGERAVIARLSKGVGTPSGVPDVLGLAFRVLDRTDSPWDFALATTGRGTVGRFVVTATRGWDRARYGSLMPYRFGDSAMTWVFARPSGDQPGTASLDAMTEHLRDHSVGFGLEVAGLRSPARPLGQVTLRAARPHDHRTGYFDPVLNHPDGIRLEPEIVGRIREFAYLGSREGRGETES